MTRTLRLGATAAFVLAATAALMGCVEHKMVIRTNPTGATVLLEDKPVDGLTPVEVPFTWEGTRRVTLLADGHEVLDTSAEVESRWFSYFPLDFFAELVWPWTIEDTQVFDFELRKYETVGAAQQDELRERHALLVERAAEYRRGGSAGPASSLDAAPPPPPAADEDPAPPPPPGSGTEK